MWHYLCELRRIVTQSVHEGSGRRAAREGGGVFVDGHVHFHTCFDAESFLHAAVSNFDATRGAVEAGAEPGVLMMTEARDERAIGRLMEAVESIAGWSARPTAEATCTMLARNGIDRLILVAGRQVATRDGIEVLAFNTAAEFPDGRPVEETLEAVWEAGSMAVVPWGFGKWWGQRGSRVRALLKNARSRPFALGDNAGRPRRAGDPALFRLAMSLGMAVIPGSDPLPFASEVTKPARYGCVVRGPIEPDRPGQSVVQAMLREGTRLESFGTRERWMRFARLQLAMQWRTRVSG